MVKRIKKSTEKINTLKAQFVYLIHHTELVTVNQKIHLLKLTIVSSAEKLKKDPTFLFLA